MEDRVFEVISEDGTAYQVREYRKKVIIPHRDGHTTCVYGKLPYYRTEKEGLSVLAEEDGKFIIAQTGEVCSAVDFA